MSNAINLKIATPAKVFKQVEADRVVIPAMEGDMAVLPDRAPAIILLREGCVRKLSADNREQEKWWISGGVAEIRDNACAIAAPQAGDEEPK